MAQSPSTVARFIQRFREAIPRSPGRRRRDRPAMEEEFWWTRSREYNDVQMGDDLGFERTTSPKDQRDEDLVARSHAALAPEEPPPLENEEDGPYGEASYQPVAEPDPPHEPNSSSGECSPVSNQTATWASPVSPSSSGPPDPPVSEDHDKTAPQPITGAGAVAHGVNQDIIGAENRSSLYSCAAEADEAQGDTLADLDERASTLLEQCRQLLAPPSAISGQVTDTKPGTIAYGLHESAFGDRMGGLSNLSREELEQRAWALLGISHRLDQGTSPDTVTGTLRSCDNSLQYAAGPHDRGNQQGKHPALGCPLAADSEVGLVRDEGNIGAGFSPDFGDDCRAWVQELENSALDYEEGDESPKLRLGSGHALDIPLFVAELSGKELAKGRRTANIQRNHGATLVSGAHAANMYVSDEHTSLACASSAQPKAAPSGLSLTREPLFGESAIKGTTSGLENKRSAMTLQTRCDQGGSSIASSLEEFAEDPVVTALLQRASQIEEELKERRSLHP